MSQADVEMLRKGFEELASDGIEAIVRYADPDIEIVTPGVVGAESFHGHEGVRRSMADQLEAFEEWTVTPEKFIEVGAQVMVEVRLHTRGRGSGVVIEVPSAWVFKVRDGHIVRLAIHSTRDEAMEAVRQDQTRRQ